MLPDRMFIEQLVKSVSKEEILPRYNKISFEVKQDGSLLTEADLAVDRRIRDELAKAYPDIGFLSEEMTLEQQTELLSQYDQLWCLDPLDGTSNFAAGLPFFATSLALLSDGGVMQAFTYDPFRDEMFSAEKGQGAFLNGVQLKCQPSGFTLDKAVAIVDLKRLSARLSERLLIKTPYKSQRNLGSCVLEWAWMAANRGHVYLHGGMKLWDLAAGTLILSEAGGYASTIEGEAVFKAGMEPRSVIISPDKALFEAWSAFLTESLQETG